MTANQQALRDFRKRYKLTQAQASEELGYNLRTWQNYEQGHRDIPNYLIKNIELYTRRMKP